jgi:hypothetical protein
MGAVLLPPYSKTNYVWRSLHDQKLVPEDLRILLGRVQITPGVLGVTVGNVAEVVPEIASVGGLLGLGRNGHRRTLRSHGLLLQLLTNLNALRGLCISRGLIGDRVRAILTEELTGVISEDVGIRQNRFISSVLIRESFEQSNSFVKL